MNLMSVAWITNNNFKIVNKTNAEIIDGSVKLTADRQRDSRTQCDICIHGKMTRTFFPKKSNRISAKIFNNLFTYASGKIHSTNIKNARTCLTLFLIKLRTRMSYSILSTLFGIQRRTIDKITNSARKTLMEDFVPNLDLNYFTKENFLRLQTRNMDKALFTEGKDLAILVTNGTYIYREKSSNYSFQRRFFSMHKGYFADGENNDANILNSLMKESSLLLEMFKKTTIWEKIYPAERNVNRESSYPHYTGSYIHIHRTVFLLANIFENFHENCVASYDLDPAHNDILFINVIYATSVNVQADRYIKLNIQFRTRAKNDFEKKLYKLMNNAVFNKIINNYVDVKLVTKWDGRYGSEAMIAEPNFHSCSVFAENLIAVELRKLEGKFNKPI
ncbi:hypothetical protein ALC56_00324 [Trachymyrmex septentrionalis]|uniref:DDE Tnp4 domain-containing protein n=1 Tax=Trachymyrmex septentrionalis TaxID=34720 RepID=A0A151K140_9HYME|nr:hypothetical protein ALC56_00324 [Trachymyrmex septentrionalis]